MKDPKIAEEILRFSMENDYSIGGPGQVAEIDECLLVKSKYRRGRELAGLKWVFGFDVIFR